jgi:hypothetical protein
MMTRRNLVLVIALLLVMPVVLLGCGGKKSEIPAVEASINGFADAYASGNYRTCADYLTETTDATRDTIIQQLSGFHQITPKIQVDSIDNVTVEGSTATADVTLTVLSKQATVKMTLSKSDDTWKFSIADLLTEVEKQLGP